MAFPKKHSSRFTETSDAPRDQEMAHPFESAAATQRLQGERYCFAV